MGYICQFSNWNFFSDCVFSKFLLQFWDVIPTDFVRWIYICIYQPENLKTVLTTGQMAVTRLITLVLVSFLPGLIDGNGKYLVNKKKVSFLQGNFRVTYVVKYFPCYFKSRA